MKGGDKTGEKDQNQKDRDCQGDPSTLGVILQRQTNRLQVEQPRG